VVVHAWVVMACTYIDTPNSGVEHKEAPCASNTVNGHRVSSERLAAVAAMDTPPQDMLLAMTRGVSSCPLVCRALMDHIKVAECRYCRVVGDCPLIVLVCAQTTALLDYSSMGTAWHAPMALAASHTPYPPRYHYVAVALVDHEDQLPIAIPQEKPFVGSVEVVVADSARMAIAIGN